MREKILAGRYVLVEQIGVGGMAIVYRAIDRNTGHSVAVKVLKPEFNRDAEFVSRFQREAEAASKMTHHNIVNLLDVGMDGENRYLIMEYVKGQTLKEVIQQSGRIRPATAVQITIRILSALQHAHQNGIIHRDIKPQNILVHADGHIKVADFGIARMANSSTLTKGDSVMGSVHYFSPEQAQGQGTDVTSDLYSVGVTLYEMLTGRVPFDGDSPVAIAMQHLHAQPEPIRRYAPEVPEAICHVCLKAMEKNPQYRYHSAREMASELRMALEGRVSEMQPRLVQTAQQPQLATPSASAVSSTRVRQTTGRSRLRKPNARLWLMTAIVALVVVYGLYVGTMAIYDKVVNSATVDLYRDSEVNAAIREINRIGLKAKVVEVHHPSISAGIVIMQTPQEDTTLRKGDTVTLTVSMGPATQTVPDICNKTIADATAILRAYGLTLSVVERVVSKTHDADFVIKQVPEAHSVCQNGETIQVTVSGGIAYVPLVKGRTLREAMELISSSGLTLNAAIEYVDTQEEIYHDRVREQSIAADTAVIQGTTLTLSVYRVQSMLRRAKVELELPASDSLVSVRVTLLSDSGEVTAYQNDFPSNASRHPEVELVSSNAGEFTYRVYVNNVFKYANTVRFE
ncbi:MAG: Stk1 family PASTA domain-containing Ser/Thr kinase [Clostridiales bacterium]|nr:Stk1 family PASTA domain-containing Ser/Thr kinase [Clostridiales bacterium]